MQTCMCAVYYAFPQVTYENNLGAHAQEVYGTFVGVVSVCLSVSQGRYHSSVNIFPFYVCTAFVSGLASSS